MTAQSKIKLEGAGDKDKIHTLTHREREREGEVEGERDTHTRTHTESPGFMLARERLPPPAPPSAQKAPFRRMDEMYLQTNVSDERVQMGV